MSVKSELTKVYNKVVEFSTCVPILRDIIAVVYGIYLGLREVAENPTYDKKQFLIDNKGYEKDELDE
ncbi:hypothetical protein [Dipodfec virus UA06Rod_21]|uniref:Uncharacterized protein n=1 Tax=Dipodfec virus UA06Rod_21 TaxID=2929321 RepID=A0A976N2B0_9VIRU|nr:hypothetical protein [Dipodfec virus UA06Rod_21]